MYEDSLKKFSKEKLRKLETQVRNELNIFISHEKVIQMNHPYLGRNNIQPLTMQQHGFETPTPTYSPMRTHQPTFNIPLSGRVHRNTAWTEPQQRVGTSNFYDARTGTRQEKPTNTVSNMPEGIYSVKVEFPVILGIRGKVGEEIVSQLNCSSVESVRFSELGCIPQFIYSLTMFGRPQEIFGELLSNAQTQYFVEETRNPFFFKLSEESFFDKQLLNSLEFNVQSLGFGTLLPDQKFNNNWTVDFEEDRSPYLNWMKERFRIKFLFDERRIFVVEVWSFKRKNSCFEHYTLSVEKNQIQRLIVSPRAHGTMELYVELDFPALIQKNNEYGRPPDVSKVQEPFYKHVCIFRGRHSNEYPDRLLMAENKFVRIELGHISSEELYVLLSRINARTHVPIEIGQISFNEERNNSQQPYLFGGDYANICEMMKFREELQMFPDADCKQFELTYTLYALMSIGATVKDQLFRDRDIFYDFAQFVITMAQYDFTMCIKVLEALVRFLNMRKKHDFVMNIMDQFFESAKRGDFPTMFNDDRLTNLHFEKIGVIALTPTRTIYKCQEVHLGNTVSRHMKDNTRMLRIIIREDDGTYLRCQNHGERKFREIILDRMNAGIRIGDRVFKFFGSSGSQQREMGMYFMDEVLIDDTWEFLGKFDHIENMYKRLAREGQSLSQSMRCNIKITREMWRIIPDYQGGMNRKGEKYTFSDGCGMISLELMKAICEDLDMDFVPCAFQFRFLGFKGMLAVNPKLDGKQIVFRMSQFKFGGREWGYIEMVKPAMPQMANLSRPFINILCQNSAANRETHTRILNRILDLYEEIFIGLAHALTDEKQFRAALKELPYLIDVDFLSQEKGFVLSQDIFLRSLVVAFVKQRLHQQINKISLPIPPNLGRSLFGVVDVTGILKPGQIFVQWTKSGKDKYAKGNKLLEVVEGRVTVTKNPCLSSGDVRIFEAVNVPELAETFWDVIVFPNHGPRPHPDEMAGSDLDGDEYIVIRDDLLLLDRNEEAFDFVTDAKLQSNPSWDLMEVKERKMEYLLDFFSKSKIGVFADAQMDVSDLYGIDSPVSKNMITKTCMALDFAKSGVPPVDLTRTETVDEVTGDKIPAERVSRKADFKKKDENGPTYASSRLNGVVYRSNRQLSSLLTKKETQTVIKKNPIFEKMYEDSLKKISKEKLRKLETQVRNELNIFISREKGIKDNYGIATEGELFSGCILQMTNRLCDREEDDRSSFTTKHIIEKMCIDLFREHRERFFEEFEGGWQVCTEDVSKKTKYYQESKNVLERRVKETPTRMIIKALLYYKLAYQRAVDYGEVFLAFAWIPSDVLAKAQDRFISSNPDFEVDMESFHDELERAVRTHCELKNDIFTHFSRDKKMQNYVSTLHNRYGDDVLRIINVLKTWADQCGLLSDGFTLDNFMVLVFLSSSKKYMKEYDTLMDAFTPFEEKDEMEDLEFGKTIARLMERLATRKTVELGKRLNTGENLDWDRVYSAARKCFMTMSIYQRFDELIGIPVHLENIEKDVLIIEIPPYQDLREVERRLIVKTGVEALVLKRKKRQNWVAVLYRGNADSEEKLRCLVQLPPPPDVHLLDTEAMDKLVATQVFANIMK